MKKNSLWLSNLRKKDFLFAWFAFHLAVFVSFGITALVTKGNISIDVDLNNIYKASFERKFIQKVDAKLANKNRENILIFVSAEDFKVAKKTANFICEQLEAGPNFTSIALCKDLSSDPEVLDFLHKYRWNLLDDETIETINSTDGAEKFAKTAIKNIFDAPTITGFYNLVTDPFLLTEHNQSNYFSNLQNSETAMISKDGLLASQKDGKWYVMIWGILSEKGASLKNKENAVAEINKVCEPFEKNGIEFVYSGAIFHDNKSSKLAKIEISLFFAILTLAIVGILFFVFRNSKPILYSVGAILISILTAIAMTFVCFHKIHILTLIFGTSLFGICINYSLHYFINWQANLNLNSGRQIMLAIVKELSLSLVITAFCFGILCFSPYAITKQISVFIISGIISSYLTAISIYPLIPLPRRGKRGMDSIKIIKSPKWNGKKRTRRIVTIVFIVLSIVLILIFHKESFIKNDLGILCEIKGRELKDEITTKNILQYTPTDWFLIKGNSEEDVLSKEESLIKKINALNAPSGEEINYLGTTIFIPSIEKQKKSREACKKLLSLALEQYYDLGYGEEQVNELIADFEDTKDNFISFKNKNIPNFLAQPISTAWIGEDDGNYYSVLFPYQILNPTTFRKIANEDNGIYFVTKMTNINRGLDTLTKAIFILLCVACLITFIILRFFAKTNQIFKIVFIPFLAILTIYTVFGIARIHLEFFSTAGMILMIGFGLNYIIHIMENEKRIVLDDAVLESYATLLSFAATVISFGILSLSSFKPVHLIGLSIFIGLITTYLSSILYDRLD